MEISIGKNIKEKRIEQKLTQNELAKAIGVTPVAISYQENNINNPNVLDIWKIADVLNMSIDELIGRNFD